jgi:ribonuclease Z
MLDHFTPCLAYSLTERMHVAIHPDRLEREGLASGPWLSRLKRLYAAGLGSGTIEAAGVDGRVVLGRVSDMVAALATVQRGRKIVYATDVAPTDDNIERLSRFAGGADILYCEACFLEADRAKAEAKGHLTAALAGEIARRAGAGRLEIFHFSPRYAEGALLRREAERSFKGD